MLIDTSQIQCFLAVAKFMNFTKAANELYLSQPVISRKVAAMEKELGVILIDRSGRNLALTPEGEKFREFFSDYIGRMDELLKELEQKRKEETGRISIGIFEGWDLTEFLHSISYDFRIRYENIEIFFESGTPLQLMEGLKNGTYDAVIMLKVTAEALSSTGTIKEALIEDLLKIEKCIIYSGNNPVAAKSDPALEDFRDQTLCCLESAQVSYEVITSKKLFHQAGFEPKIQMFKTVDAISIALLTGACYAILDDATRIFRYRGIRHVLLGESHTISLVMLPKHSQYAEILKQYLKSKYQNQ